MARRIKRLVLVLALSATICLCGCSTGGKDDGYTGDVIYRASAAAQPQSGGDTYGGQL